MKDLVPELILDFSGLIAGTLAVTYGFLSSRDRWVAAGHRQLSRAKRVYLVTVGLLFVVFNFFSLMRLATKH
jgi:multisubunit Na+/H+ antiporter MnhB subunit